MSEFEEYTSGHSILFDLDGTIIDSRVGIIETLHKVVSELGHIPDKTIDLTWVVGPPLAELMAEVIGVYGDTRWIRLLLFIAAFMKKPVVSRRHCFHSSVFC
ncbi:HAD family hydrolase [Asaia prunellae]|uniref:HAD family hydrolase n=1 Tax=Asaia prunellae TaxID=610245 RepID=UPI00243531E8|nr:HAD hydrolase-like protein [Asaia prunellae]